MSEQKNEATMQMVEAILTKGHSENHDYFSKEKAKIEAEQATQLAQLAADASVQKERIAKSLKQAYAQKEQREILLTNQAIVKEKQQYLQQLYDGSLVALKNVTATDFLAIVGPLFTANDLSGEIEVLVGEYSQDYLTSAVLADFASQHPGEISYQLAESVVAHDGGFILGQGGIEYNFLFSSILAQVSEEKEFQLAEDLFADGSD